MGKAVGLALVVLDMLFWCTVATWACAGYWALFIYVPHKLTCRQLTQPHWNTPWQFFVHVYLKTKGVRVVDAQHGNMETDLILPNVQEFKGAVLTNHRSFGDFAIDPHMCDCPIIARLAAVFAYILLRVRSISDIIPLYITNIQQYRVV